MSSRTERAIIGVSGGLDSTQALIVTCRAMDQLKLPRKNIFAYTLPGFGTSDKTHKNAWRLMEALGVTAAEIDIKPAAQQMLADIGHPFAKGKKVYDVTFENVQAGLRTDYLFRLANQQGGMVVGTGDLSELGLGWCTYGVGDHMSHYNPNGSVSKTLIQHLIRFVAASGDVSKETAEILHDILDTEISPELIPAGATRRHPVDRAVGRPLRAAGLQPLLPDAAGLPAVQDRVPGLECLARHRQGRLARQPAGRDAAGL